MDLLPLYEKMKEYAGLIPQLTDSVETAKEAQSRLTAITEQHEQVRVARLCERPTDGVGCQENSKVSEKDVELVQGRRDVLHLLSLAEMNQFTTERREDLKEMMKEYLDEQISFYQSVCGEHSGGGTVLSAVCRSCRTCRKHGQPSTEDASVRVCSPRRFVDLAVW